MSDTPNIDYSYLTIAQTADALSCSADSVRRLIARGELRAYRFGRLIRIAAGDIGRAGRPISQIRTRRPSADSSIGSPTPSGKRADESWGDWAERRQNAG